MSTRNSKFQLVLAFSSGIAVAYLFSYLKNHLSKNKNKNKNNNHNNRNCDHHHHEECSPATVKIHDLIFKESLRSDEYVTYTQQEQKTNVARSMVLDEAKKFNINSRLLVNPSFTGVNGGIIVYQYGKHQEILHNGMCLMKDILEFNLGRYKLWSYQFLALCGISVPRSMFIGLKKKVCPDMSKINCDGNPVVGFYLGESVEEICTDEKLFEFIRGKFNYLSKGVIIKPDAESRGTGVTLIEAELDHNLEQENKNLSKGLRNAFKASLRATGVLVQEAVWGKEYRFCVHSGVINSVYERIAPIVTGDAKHTIRELIDLENMTEWRKKIAQIKINEDLMNNLSKYKYDLDSIPTKGQRINLHSVLNLSVGGLARDVTDLVHQSWKNLFLDLHNRIGLRQNGVDVICSDISLDVTGQQYYIIDWNNGGGLRAHQEPSFGKRRNVARSILGEAFPELRSHPIYWTEGGPAPNELASE